MYTPDTAVDGTAQLADSDQLPQSIKPVALSVIGDGCATPVKDPRFDINLAPLPW
jgi:hypothetical protein